ncbi:hypothetical protein P4H08_19115 [Bacillus cereus]|uniref:Uncharacterized protein n=1 Tax=Bacillus fungorum TaxID=2039284 RepID=A0A2G6Q7H1_9BACI|nr:hypothetical protein [Bacillus fungorum]MEB8675398.1 hypothetical protein [Bacillus cereus]PIE92776.1 hypothetical protein CO726_24735 [Bacillus fungorum]
MKKVDELKAEVTENTDEYTQLCVNRILEEGKTYVASHKAEAVENKLNELGVKYFVFPVSKTEFLIEQNHLEELVDVQHETIDVQKTFNWKDRNLHWFDTEFLNTPKDIKHVLSYSEIADYYRENYVLQIENENGFSSLELDEVWKMMNLQ